jgi:hypothetical protein
LGIILISYDFVDVKIDDFLKTKSIIFDLKIWEKFGGMCF